MFSEGIERDQHEPVKDFSRRLSCVQIFARHFGMPRIYESILVTLKHF